MKIQAVHLHNQIPENLKKVDRTDVNNSSRYEEITGKQIAKDIKNVQDENISFKLNEVTQRILSQSEKQTISDNFCIANSELSKAYTQQGKSVNMEVMIGKKIDITG